MRIATVILVVVLLGCRQRAAESDQPAKLTRAQAIALMSNRSYAGAKHPILEMGPRLRLDVYHLSLPYGTISGNELFWRNVDEQRVDVATYDLLFKNGVRVGVAPIADWEHFRQIMDEHPARHVLSSLHGTEGKSVDLGVRKLMETQNIFYFDRSNVLQGRTYDRCENLLTLSFQPAPRKEGQVRVVLCPVVKSTRKRLEYTENARELEFTYTNPERLYDLNLRADIAADEFMIVAPSSESTWPSSIGNSFFVHDGVAERVETVLLLVPRVSP